MMSLSDGLRFAVGAILTAVVVAASRYGEEYLRWLLAIVFDHVTRPTLQVREVDGQGYKNAHFLHFAWFLSERRHHDGDCTISRKGAVGETVIIPRDSRRFRRIVGIAGHEGLQFRVTTVSSPGAFNRVEDVRAFEIRGPGWSVDQAVGFLARVEALHEEHVRSRRWAQEIYIHSSSDWELLSTGPRCDGPAPTLDERVFLDKGVHDALAANVGAFMGGRDEYAALAQSWKAGYLLCGPPGTGKTTLIRALAECYRMPIYLLTLNTVTSDVDLVHLFLRLPTSHPCMIVMEELDVVCPVAHSRRCPVGASVAVGATASLIAGSGGLTLSGLLNALDGVVGCHGRVVIATTNHPELLDPALLRPGRFDMRVDLGRCTVMQTKAMFTRFFGEDMARMAERRLQKAFDAATGEPPTPAEVSGLLLSHRRDANSALLALETRLFASLQE